MDQINKSFSGIVSKDETSGWTCVFWPDSVSILGTGKAAKVTCTVDSHPLDVTLMPSGKGSHFVPLNAANRKLIGKDIGDTVIITIQSKR